MNKNRIAFIDNLRAFSLIGVVVIHVLSFHLVKEVNVFFWNILQFVVIAFIFCSGFVTAHYESKLINFSVTRDWYIKRLKRLYIPFFIYFLIHFLLFFMFPTVFTHFGLQKDLRFFIGSLVLLWGTNTNWLPLIFVELTFLTPLLFLLQRKKFLWMYILIASIITGYFTIFTFPYSYYRYVMWIPWSFILLSGLLYPKLSRKNTMILFMLNIGIFTATSFFFWQLHKSFSFYDNKYPPTFYYLSFGGVCTMLFFFILSHVKFSQGFQKVLSYISTHSYPLFFIHYIVLDFFESTRLSNYFLLEIVVVCITTGNIYLGVTYVYKFLRNSLYSFSAKTTVRSE